jgi:2-polyprenyl-6-methoxyphenol hydroxylase-like FAD-dependent oxidoreductase
MEENEERPGWIEILVSELSVARPRRLCDGSPSFRGMNMSERVIIVGGGPGGLAAAVALQKVGISATVFERAPELKEVGAGLSLWSNATTALSRIGLADAVIARGTILERALTLTANGKQLSDVSLGDIARQVGQPSVCVHRADLQQVLAEAAQPVLAADCVKVTEDADGVTVQFADGRSERGALVIGADGIRSAVRAHLHGPTEPRRAGYVAYRGIARCNLPESSPDRSRLILGPGAQAGIFPCGPGRVYWFATSPAPEAPPTDSPSDLKARALELFRNWLPLLNKVIDATDSSAVMRHDITDLLPIWPWGRGRLSLLGDAAHATTPNLGQGACQAIEDAVVLAHCLSRDGLTPMALRNYEEARRERTERIVRLSRSMGKVLQWKNPIKVWLRNGILGFRMGRRQGVAVFEELLGYPLPELHRSAQSRVPSQA